MKREYCPHCIGKVSGEHSVRLFAYAANGSGYICYNCDRQYTHTNGELQETIQSRVERVATRAKKGAA